MKRRRSIKHDDVPLQQQQQPQIDKNCEIDGLSDCPTHIAELIVSKLNVRDLVRFSAVSTSWRVIARTIFPLPESRIPWLLIGQTRARYRLLNLLDRRVYQFPRLQSSRVDVLGSSNGWLITPEYLFNPFNGTKKALKQALINSRNLQRAPFSARDVLFERNFVVVGGESDDETLVVIPHAKSAVVSHGTIYSLFKGGTIHLYDWITDVHMVFELGFNNVNQETGIVVNDYLVQSGMDLFLVRQKVCSEKGYTIAFEVYKVLLFRSNPALIRVRNLGDQAFFVGKCGSFSLPAIDYLHKIRRNCIYFSMCTPRCYSGIDCWEFTIGIYCLEDGSFQPFFPLEVLIDGLWIDHIWISSKFPF